MYNGSYIYDVEGYESGGAGQACEVTLLVGVEDFWGRLVGEDVMWDLLCGRL